MITTAQFIEQSKTTHGDKYDYSQTTYKSSRERVTIICKDHGAFTQMPYQHKTKSGCPKCDPTLKKTTDKFISQSIKLHGDMYDYSDVTYIGALDSVYIKCKTHGAFIQTPSSHLSGTGCPSCSKERVGNKNSIRGKTKFNITQDVFIERSNKIHKNSYSYVNVDYKNYYTKVVITCNNHGTFLQTPDSHLHGNGCPSCSHTSKFSKKSIDWLNAVILDTGHFIQHAGNVGEYTIPGTRIKVDGWCEVTNTVYEFHGDKWHGNPELYTGNEYCHPFDKTVTAGELYERTILREQKLKDLGYTLIVKWETQQKKIVI